MSDFTEPNLTNPNTLIAQAINDHLLNLEEKQIQVWLNQKKEEDYMASYFLRSREDMPKHEVLALSLAVGEILDIGAGAGAHTVELCNANKNVTALELNHDLAEIIKNRCDAKVLAEDIFKWKAKVKYDTILLLMNGLGIAQTKEKVPELLEKVKHLLAIHGKAYVELTDYNFSTEYDHEITAENEVTFRLKYGSRFSEEMSWIYPSLTEVENHCHALSLRIKILYQEDETLLLELTHG